MDDSGSRPAARLAAVVMLVAGTALAYSNSFSGPLVFDDIASITENASLRSWSPPWAPLIPQHGAGNTVDGRPVLNFSLALNYAAGGTAVAGYHLVNLLIHVAAALVLFGLVRRTLLLPRLAENFGRRSLPIAFATALLWALHPLQTESVTYIIQRAESLVSLFYLLTLYCFARGAVSPRPRRWLAAGTGACLCGMVIGGLLKYVKGSSTRRDALDKLSIEQVAEIIEHGNAIGALACTKAGAIPALPTKAELEKFLSSQTVKSS